tara:strand:+ start:3477 stop:3620 length:144 start_codon:yes stop_codon:yes gene_type:complete
MHKIAMILGAVLIMVGVSSCGKKGAVLPPPGWDAPAQEAVAKDGISS